MKRNVIWPALALLAVATVAQAHSTLQKSTPAHGSVVRSPPQALELDFSEETRLTALTLQKGKEEPRKLTVPSQAAAHMSIPLPTLTPGTYFISWRGISKDTHVRTGTIRFTLSAGTKTTHSPQP